MKKLVSLLMAFILICGAVSLASAEKLIVNTDAGIHICGDFKYVILDDGTAEITRYTGKDDVLVIPEELDGWTVTSIGSYTFIYNSSLTDVTVPEGVTNIGDWAFRGCSYLKKIDIPDSIKNIGDWAFYQCPSLSDVRIPNTVTNIGDLAFGWCSSLISISIPDSLISMGGNPFASCSNLESVNVSPDHTYLDIIDGALISKPDHRLISDPSAIDSEQYSIPNGITAIGSYAFFECEKLTSIIIPDSVTHIGEMAFEGCIRLENIMIPDSVISVEGNPFYGCYGLREIVISPEHPYLATIDGVLFSKPDKRLVCYPAYKRSDPQGSEFYAIPNGIKSIGNYAFLCDYGYGKSNNLTTIIIPDSVTTIGTCAFADCDKLTDITIPGSVVSIGDMAFLACQSLTEISIPDGVSSIEDMTFAYCSSLTSITIPASVTSIGNLVFEGCRSLNATVSRGSYAAQYCKENNIKYTYSDALDWLNN